MGKYEFAYLRRGIDSSDIILDGKVIGGSRHHTSLLAEMPELVTVNTNNISHGGGMLIRHGTDEWWLPCAVVRGHPPATTEELDAAPDWARQAYEWWSRG